MGTNRIVTKTVKPIIATLNDATVRARLFNGDCRELLAAMPNESVDLTLTSPPYCIGKEYEKDDDIESFIEAHKEIFPEIVRTTKSGGNICWQVGFHVKNGVVLPLDYLVYQLLGSIPGIVLRNRIVWTYGHGFHCENRFSGRYEVVMWFSKGDKYHFDVDAVRVPQKYPGKRHSKGPNRGALSGNPKGKNPSDIWCDITDDVWHIPNVKANHVEKTEHPCQFPVALATRLIRALSPREGIVLDPFAGVASTGVASVLEGRRFIGAELSDSYSATARDRLLDAIGGAAKIRPLEREIYEPKPNEKVAMKPAHFWENLEDVAASS